MTQQNLQPIPSAQMLPEIVAPIHLPSLPTVNIRRIPPILTSCPAILVSTYSFSSTTCPRQLQAVPSDRLHHKFSHNPLHDCPAEKIHRRNRARFPNQMQKNIRAVFILIEHISRHKDYIWLLLLNLSNQPLIVPSILIIMKICKLHSSNWNCNLWILVSILPNNEIIFAIR